MLYHCFRHPAVERAGRGPLLSRLVLPAAVVVPMALLPAASGGAASATSVTTRLPGATRLPGSGRTRTATWPTPGRLRARRSRRRTCRRLREAWAFKLTGKAAAGVSGTGSLTAAPVVHGGAVYIQDQDANVYALSLATGKLMWEYQANLPEKSGPGPDGVAVADGTVYGDTSTSVFALNAGTGKTTWVDQHLLNKGQGSFEIQPQVADGRVYLASAYGSGPAAGC